MLNNDLEHDPLQNEEDYFMRIPWVDFYLKPLNEDDPNLGELLIHSDAVVDGYFARAKPGEFYISPVPGMRIDYGNEDLFEYINGIKFYKTNDALRRSPLSGKYKYISRLDSVITFATGLKMNPIPFEGTISYECNDISYCCLLLDSTQTEVICFVEPNWNEIIIDSKKFDTTIDPSSLNKAAIKSMSKAVQE